MAGMEFAVDRSLVYCSCAPEIPAFKDADKEQEKYAEYWRELRVTESNNGSFADDALIVRESDCVPYENIQKEFIACQAPRYIQALTDIQNNLASTGLESRLAQEKYAFFTYCLKDAIEQEVLPLKKRKYKCILAFSKQWYECSQEYFSSDYLQLTAKYTKQIRDALQRYLTALLKETDRAIKLLQKKCDKSFGILSFLTNEEDQITDWDEESVLSSIEYMKSLKNDILNENDIILGNLTNLYWMNIPKDALKDDNDKKDRSRIFLHDHFYKMNGAFLDITRVLNRYGIQGFLGKESEYLLESSNHSQSTSFLYDVTNSELDSSRSTLACCLDTITSSGLLGKMLDDTLDQAIVTMNSFLVCKCGGFITIKLNGTVLQQNARTIVPNTILFLKQVESYLTDEVKYGDKKAIESGLQKVVAIRKSLESPTEGLKAYEQIENMKLSSVVVEIIPMKKVQEKSRKDAGFGNFKSLFFDIGAAGLDKGTEKLHQLNPKYKPINTSDKIGVTKGVEAALFGNEDKEYIHGNENTDTTGLDKVGGFAAGATMLGVPAAAFVNSVVGAFGTIISAYDMYNNLNYESGACYNGEIKVTVYTNSSAYVCYDNYDIGGAPMGFRHEIETKSSGYRTKIKKGLMICCEYFDGNGKLISGVQGMDDME